MTRSPVGELHLQDPNVVNDRGRNGGDEEEDGGSEEEKGPNVVDDAGSSHLDGDVQRVDPVGENESATCILPCMVVFAALTLKTTLRRDEILRCNRDDHNNRERGDRALFSF